MFLPLNPVFNLLYVLHLFWGGLGVYVLLRIGFRLDYIPALVGALTFALGGKLLARLRFDLDLRGRLGDLGGDFSRRLGVRGILLGDLANPEAE